MDTQSALIEQLMARLEASLVRERAFREDFTQSIKAELMSAMARQTIGPLAVAPGAEVMMRTRDGHRLILDMREKFMALHLLEHGVWEDHVRDCLALVLEPGALLLDIGANIGVHALYAANLVGPTGAVLAYEPHPTTGAICRENIEINGMLDRILLSDRAFSDRDDEIVDFEYFPEHPAMSGFKVMPQRLARFAGTTETIKVRTTTIDAVMRSLPVCPTVIKIDVEGFELTVMRGAMETLLRRRDIAYIIEFQSSLSQSMVGESSLAALAGLFETAGYSVFALRHQHSDVQALSHSDLDAETTGDYLFIGPASPAYAKVITRVGQNQPADLSPPPRRGALAEIAGGLRDFKGGLPVE